MENTINTTATTVEHRTIAALRERRVVRRNASEAAVARAERNAKMHPVSQRPIGKEVEVPLQGDYNTAKAALLNNGPVENIRVETDYATRMKTLVANRIVD